MKLLNKISEHITSGLHLRGRCGLLVAVLFMLMLSSCHSHRKVVRGSDGIAKDKVKIEDTRPPKYTGSADNKVTNALFKEAYSWIGTPYKYGGKDKSGMDCSGFVMVVFKNALDIELPRVSRDQGEYCKYIKKEQLFPGDLVFFATGSTDKVTHVGIYLGDGKMIHASSSRGVIVTDITQKYYVEHLHHYGRVEKYFKMMGK